LGYNPELIYSTRFMLLPAKYPDDAKRVLFVDRVLAQLAGKPGIEAAAITSALPFHQNPMTLFTIEGRPETDRMKLPRGIIAMITPDYFKAMSNPLLAGRWFTERDTPDASNVAIISEQLAKEYFPGENPLGKRIDLSEPGGAKRPNSGAPKWREIVGIVSNIKTQGPAQPMIPQVYLPFAYGPQQQFMGVVRVKKGAPNPSPVVAAAVHAVDPTMPVGMAWIAEYFVHSIQVQRFALFLFSIFSGVALLLAAIGIYGMMAYSVGQRTNEIGVRLALGAQRSDIFALILKQAARLVVMGLTIGVAGSVAGSQLLRSLLYGVSPYDFATFVAIAAVFTLVAFFACWFPARRATKVDPMVALRSE
jgi:putative ABC transport system permease protein